MLTQKDLYDYIAKNGVDAYDRMVSELADNVNKAKAAYNADQEKEAKKAAMVEKRTNDFADLLHEWWTPEDIAPLSYEALAKSACDAIDNFTSKRDQLMKHAKNVKTETTKVPGGTKTVTTAELDPDDVKMWIDEILDLFN